MGPVNLKNPDVKLWFMEYYGLDPNRIPEKPYLFFFGRWVCILCFLLHAIICLLLQMLIVQSASFCFQITEGQRRLMKEFSLKTRKFIGNTSMDAQISVLMANQARVKSGDLVLDPFVGTGEC